MSFVTCSNASLLRVSYARSYVQDQFRVLCGDNVTRIARLLKQVLDSDKLSERTGTGLDLRSGDISCSEITGFSRQTCEITRCTAVERHDSMIIIHSFSCPLFLWGGSRKPNP